MVRGGRGSQCLSRYAHLFPLLTSRHTTSANRAARHTAARVAPTAAPTTGPDWWTEGEWQLHPTPHPTLQHTPPLAAAVSGSVCTMQLGRLCPHLYLLRLDQTHPTERGEGGRGRGGEGEERRGGEGEGGEGRVEKRGGEERREEERGGEGRRGEGRGGEGRRGEGRGS